MLAEYYCGEKPLIYYLLKDKKEKEADKESQSLLPTEFEGDDLLATNTPPKYCLHELKQYN